MLHCLEHLYAVSGFHLGVFFFFLIAFFCLQHLARDDYCIGRFSLVHQNHHPHFHLHSHPEHPHHPHHPRHFHHPHHPLRPHYRRHQLIPVTITFVIISFLSFLHRSGQQFHQHQKVGPVCDSQQLQKTT